MQQEELILVNRILDEQIKKHGGTPVDRQSFLTIIEFLDEFPDSLSWRGKNKPHQDTEEYFYRLSEKFFASRTSTQGLKKPETVPDELVSYILQIYCGYSICETQRIEEEHRWSMAAENIVGDLLERYIGQTLEPYGWSWCSGNFVKAIDLIRKQDGEWDMLQIKNRDNTENSSSRAIRSGTKIETWFRSFSKKTEKNWSAFPDEQARNLLSEEGFKSFVKEYLSEAKKQIKKLN